LRLSAVGAALIEYVPGIVLHTMFFQKRDEFILECHLAMVCLLIQNIPLHRLAETSLRLVFDVTWC